jgi:hypothetical protein
MAVAFNILRKWSWARDKTNTNNVKWAHTPFILLKQWPDAYQWHQIIKIFKDPDVEKKYYFKSGCAAEIESIGTIKKYEQLITNCLWKTFDEFRNCSFGIWRVTIQTTDVKSIWKKSSCTCPTFFKKYICKHIIGTAIRTIPGIRKSIPLTA